MTRSTHSGGHSPQAREYRKLHAHLSGPVLSDAIEQVALALKRAANELEAELANTAGLPRVRADKEGPEFRA